MRSQTPPTAFALWPVSAPYLLGDVDQIGAAAVVDPRDVIVKAAVAAVGGVGVPEKRAVSQQATRVGLSRKRHSSAMRAACAGAQWRQRASMLHGIHRVDVDGLNHVGGVEPVWTGLRRRTMAKLAAARRSGRLPPISARTSRMPAALPRGPGGLPVPPRFVYGDIDGLGARSVPRASRELLHMAASNRVAQACASTSMAGLALGRRVRVPAIRAPRLSVEGDARGAVIVEEGLPSVECADGVVTPTERPGSACPPRSPHVRSKMRRPSPSYAWLAALDTSSGVASGGSGGSHGGSTCAAQPVSASERLRRAGRRRRSSSASTTSPVINGDGTPRRSPSKSPVLPGTMTSLSPLGLASLGGMPSVQRSFSDLPQSAAASHSAAMRKAARERRQSAPEARSPREAEVPYSAPFLSSFRDSLVRSVSTGAVSGEVAMALGIAYPSHPHSPRSSSLSSASGGFDDSGSMISAGGVHCGS